MMATPETVHHSELEVVSPKAAPAPKAEQYGGLQYHPDEVPRGARTICGLRPTTFVLMSALILVILAAGIGGGIGGSMAVKNAQNCASSPNTESCHTVTNTYTASTTYTTTGSSTTSSILAVPTVGRLPLDCPNIDNTNIRITLKGQTSVFAVTCGEDFGSANNKPFDILAIISYSLRDCAQACASYNFDSRQNLCKGATFNSDLTGSVASNFGTCFLKSDTAGALQSTYNSYAGLVLK